MVKQVSCRKIAKLLRVKEREVVFLKLKKIFCITGVIFTLSLLLIVGYVISGYRNLKNEVKNQLLSEQSIAEDISSGRTLSRPVAADREAGILGQKGVRKSLLKLRLLGTVLGNPAIAYIEDLASGREGTYNIGDIISDAKIIDIQSGKVILERDGQREILTLIGSRKEAIIKLSPTEMIVSRRGVLNEIGSDIDKTLIMAKVLPHFDFASKQFSGFKIDNIRKGSIAESAGLRNGDIIRVVNDQELSSPQKAIQMFRKVRNQSQIDVDVLRKSRLIRLRYKIEN